MSSSKFYREWQLALISANASKLEKIQSIIGPMVNNFSGISSFNDHLMKIPNPKEYLILIVPAHLVIYLPSDINEKLYKLYIYGEKDENDLPSFNDICLHLSNLIIAQCTEKSICCHRSNENGYARFLAQESISRSQNLIEQLQDLCNDIDSKLLIGKEAMD